MKAPIVFSVVIPNYKRVKELLRAVKSALDQGELVQEVVVVDDCSDNITDIERALTGLDSSKVKLIKNTAKGNAAQTRNQGARACCAPWISFLDSDDTFLPGKLASIRQVINAGEAGNKAFYNRAEVLFNGDLETRVPSRPLMHGEHIADYLFSSSEVMQTSMLTVPRSFFEDSGFNERYIRHQDFDLCLTLHDQGYEFIHINHLGTAIYWSSNERPLDKGESIDYSKNWALENRQRMTQAAFNNFFFYFVILKACRSGNKARSIRERRSIEGLAGVPFKKQVLWGVLLLIPSCLMNIAYRKYKSFMVSAKRLMG